MQQRFPVEVPLLLDRVQVTHRSLYQAHERLGASLVLFEHVAAVRSKYCKQAIKTVHTMGELAASLHGYLLTQNAPASLTASLRLKLSLLTQYTNKAAMQLVLVQSCCRRHPAIALWLHQQGCAYLDTVLELNRETLRELARFATQVRCDQQEASVEGADGVIASCKGAGNDDPTSTTRAPAQHV